MAEAKKQSTARQLIDRFLLTLWPKPSIRIGMKLKSLLAGLFLLGFSAQANAQSQLYPGHFNLNEVTLLDGPMKTAMEKNIEMLMQYDVDRLLTPFGRTGLDD